MKVKREDRSEDASGEGARALKSNLERRRSAIAGGRPTTSLSEKISYEEDEDENEEEEDWETDEDNRVETCLTASKMEPKETGGFSFLSRS